MSNIIYPDIKENDTYYVYKFTIDGVVRYIGKGKGKRVLSHERQCKYNKTMWHKYLNKAILDNKKIEVFIEGFYETNVEASTIEIQLISCYGRKAFGEGELMNYQAGGQGGDSITSKLLWENVEYRKKCMEANKNPDTKKKRSVATTTRWKDQNYKNKVSTLMKAAGKTEKAKHNKSMASKKLWESDKHRDIMSAIMIERWKDDNFKNSISNYRRRINIINSIASKYFKVKYTEVSKTQRIICESLLLGVHAL